MPKSPPPDDTPSDNACRICTLKRGQIPEVLAIEEASFDFPWNEEDFLNCGRQHCSLLVAVKDDKVVGYMVYGVHEERFHILNIAVHPDFRRQGIGSALMDRLINEKYEPHLRERITLAVRTKNLAAQKFFRKHKFDVTEVLRNYYEDSGEDAKQMERARNLSIESSPAREDASPKLFSPEAQLIQQARKHLIGLTHTEWKVVRRNDAGKFEDVDDYDRADEFDLNDLFLQSCGPVSNPQRAYDALRLTLFPDWSRLPENMKARNNIRQRIHIPFTCIESDRQCLSRGKPGMLAESFSPHDPEEEKGWELG